jgi:hypothetical protein
MATTTVKELSNKTCSNCGAKCINCPGCGEETSYCMGCNKTAMSCTNCGTVMTPTTDEPAVGVDQSLPVVPSNPAQTPQLTDQLLDGGDDSTLSDQIADLYNLISGMSFIADCVNDGLRDYQLNPPRPGSDNMSAVLDFQTQLNQHINSLYEGVESFQIQMDSIRDRNLSSNANEELDKELDKLTAAQSKNPSDYLVVEDKTKPSTWHLPVKKNGKPDHGLMGAAWAALHSGYRGSKYAGPKKSEAIKKLKALYKSEKMQTPAEKAGIADEFIATSSEPEALQKLRKVMKDQNVPFVPVNESTAKKEKPVDTKTFTPPQSDYISKATQGLLDKYLLKDKAGLKAEDAEDQLTDYLFKQPVVIPVSDKIDNPPASSENVDGQPKSGEDDLTDYIIKDGEKLDNQPKEDIPAPATVDDVAPKAPEGDADFLQEYLLDEASTKDINLDDYLLMENNGVHTNLMYKVKNAGKADHKLMKSCYAELQKPSDKHSEKQRKDALKRLEKLFKEEGLPLPKDK